MKNSINLISVPFDSAHFNERMGAGPRHIIASGLIKKIETGGTKVFYKEIVEQETFPTEIVSTFKLLNLIQEEIKKATQNDSLPIVLSGNCCATVGVIAGLNTNDIGIIWFDAHGDCETPQTTTSGFLDGMGMSMLLNSCWQNLLSSHKLNSSLTGNHVILVGARNLSPYEEQFISENGINHVTVNEIEHSNTDRIKAACTEFISAGIQKIHLHIDVDVFDPLVAPSNSYSVECGLGKNEVINIINSCLREIPLTSVTIASYDPSFDTNGDMLKIINELIETIIKQYNKTNAQNMHLQ